MFYLCMKVSLLIPCLKLISGTINKTLFPNISSTWFIVHLDLFIYPFILQDYLSWIATATYFRWEAKLQEKFWFPSHFKVVVGTIVLPMIKFWQYIATNKDYGGQRRRSQELRCVQLDFWSLADSEWSLID